MAKDIIAVEAVRKLRLLDPGATVIASSGYSDEAALSDPGSYGFAAALPKPYSPNAVAAVLSRVLKANPRGPSEPA